MNLGHYLTLNQVPGLGKSQLAEPLRLTGSKMSITLELTDLSTGTRLPVVCCHPSRFQKVQRPFPIRVPLHRYVHGMNAEARQATTMMMMTMMLGTLLFRLRRSKSKTQHRRRRPRAGDHLHPRCF